MTDHPTIGASQISAILGIHPWLTQHDVWKELVHGVKQEDNETLKRGRDWEADILAKYRRLTGRQVRHNHAMKSQTRGHLHATPDGLARPRLVQAKTSAETWDVLPTYYYNQEQVELYCWPEYESADVAVMFAFFGFKIFEDIKPDLDLQEKLNAAAERFIKDYVLPKRLPPIDHTEACRGAIVAQWPTPESQEYLEADDDDLQWLLTLQVAEVERESLEEQLGTIKNYLRTRIAEKTGIKSKIARVDFKSQNGRTTIDHKAVLKDLWPQIGKKGQSLMERLLQKHTTTGPGPRTLRIFWNKDKGGDDDQAEA